MASKRCTTIEIAKFFKSGKPPVGAEETIELSRSWKPPKKVNAKTARE